MKQKEKPNYFATFEVGRYYHVYNRTNNKEALFKNDKDRIFFLKKYVEYLNPYIETFCYCLLDNHFHFLIRLKKLEEILQIIESLNEKTRTVPQKKLRTSPKNLSILHEAIERQFTRLFTSYAMYFNKVSKRSGNLFHRPFKRLEIMSEIHFTSLIFYIHTNPVKHKISDDFQHYTWSSYQSILSTKPTNLQRSKVLEWFGNREAFVLFHNGEKDFGNISDLLLE